MTAHNPFAKCTNGDRYVSEVPDTLDLADRMGLAINPLTNVWDPDEGFALRFCVDFRAARPCSYTRTSLKTHI